jgi:type I site-specific restriction-modification system R (restriction) subunit
MLTKESQIEQRLIKKLTDLKYTYRQDIRTQQALEHNFREKFEALNRVNLNDSEFTRLHEQIITADVFTAAKIYVKEIPLSVTMAHCFITRWLIIKTGVKTALR